MRTALLLLPLAFVVTAAAPGRADDKAKAILDKAVAAHGGAAQLAKLRTMRIKLEGTDLIFPDVPPLPITIESVWQHPGRYRSSTTHRPQRQGPFTQSLILDGDKGWNVLAGGTVKELTEARLAAARELRYVEELDRLAFVKQEGYEVAALGEVKVNDRPADGVLVKSKGRPDVKLYFDRETSLLVKRERGVWDSKTGKEVPGAVVFSDHQDKDGVKHYRKLTTLHDGKVRVEAKVTEIEFLDKADPKLFEKP